MQKIILIVFLLLGVSLHAQRTYNPTVASQAKSSCNIYGVLCYQTKTIILLDCAASRFGSSSISINSHTLLTSREGGIRLPIKRWGMYDKENDILTEREFGKSCTIDEGTHAYCFLEFDVIPTGIENISINENLSNGLYWNEIRIKNSAKMEDVTGNSVKINGSNNNSDKQTTIGDLKASGSGFFINEKGYIVTNHHVINNSNKIEVVYYKNGTRFIFDASIILTDKINDLAVIKITDEKFSSISKIPYKLDYKTLDVASEVFTLGYPLTDVMGDEVKYTKGEISAKSGYQGDMRTYQISVPITHGNSSGPLFDYNGNIVGITSYGLNAGLVDNVNYAIKSVYLKALIEASQEKIELPTGQNISTKSNAEKIKLIKDYVVYIKVK